MLTVRKIGVAVGDQRGAMAAARYPLELADSPEAFMRPGDRRNGGPAARANAMWLGSPRALARLGVERGEEVTAERLASALQGRHVVSGAQVRSPGPRTAVDKQGRPRLNEKGEEYCEAVVNSFDLTFSVPKSVSVLWSQADAELRAKVEQAVMDAAGAAIEHIAGTRPVVGGKALGHGFAAAAALQVVARMARDDVVPAPHLHVHMHFVGVLDDRGQLRTPNSEALYKNSAMREAGAVGRARLAENLKALELRVEAGTGRGGRYFEVAGIAKELCDQMSGRSREVKAWAKEREAELGGKLSNREGAVGALLTRTPKAALSSELIQAGWDGVARTFGFGQARIAELRVGPALEGGPEPSAGRTVQELREQVRETILKRMWEEGPTVSMGAVRSMAFELAPMGLSLDDVGGVLARLQAEGDLIAVDGWRVTTREIRTREEYVRTVAVEAAQRSEDGLSDAAVAQGIQVAERDLGGFSLDPEQEAAVKKLTSGTGWACLTGPAGTGKGPVLQAVAEAHRQDGWQVIACALDGATTQRLGHQVGAPALTIEQLRHRLKSGQLDVDERTLILIDEASKVGLRHWAMLARVIDVSGGRMIPVGDTGQVGGIECPGMLDVMLKTAAIRTARLSEVRRHRDPDDSSKTHPWLVDYQTKLYDGRAGKAIDVLRRKDAIAMYHTRQEAMRGLVDKWELRRRDHGIAAQDAVLIVHGPNAEVDQVNELAQERRRVAGEIGGAAVRAVDRDYLLYAGDVVMLREAAYQPDRDLPGSSARVENGTMGIVEFVDARHDLVWVAFDKPEGGTRRVGVKLGALRAQVGKAADGRQAVPTLRLAYAGHPFPMQGATFRYVGSLWGHWSQRKENTYSGDTRAKLWLDVHIDRESLGWKGTDDDRYNRFAKLLGKPWHRLASLTYEETPGTPIFESGADIGTVPDLPLRGDRPVEEPSEARPALQFADPLVAYEDLLGQQRLAPIRRRADALAAEMADLDDVALRAECDRGQQSVGRLNRAAARETRRIERDQALVAARINNALDSASELEVEADRLRGFQARHERGELLQAADAHRRAAEYDELALGRLTDRELEILAGRWHPDQWVRAEEESFARGIAAQRHLLLKRELGMHEEAEGAAPEQEREGPAQGQEPDAGPEVGF